MNNKVEYIVCAAYRFKEGYRTPNMVKWTEKTGEMVEEIYKEPWREVFRIATGWRHADILYKWGPDVLDQSDLGGFMTSKGRYVDREEAAKIAKAAGQLDERRSKNITYLYSEDIY